MDPLASQSKDQLIALIGQLRAVIDEQAQTLRLYQQQIQALTQQVEDQKQEIADLKSGGQGKKPPPSPPEWVKPNTKTSSQADKKARKKRADNASFERLQPTRVIEHACESCPDCGRGLSGGWEYSRRQIVELPPIQVEVVDHVRIARRCGVCQKVCVPEVELGEEALPHSHLGHRLVSLIAYLRIVGRLPIQSIQALLEAFVGLSLGAGSLCEGLHRLARCGQEEYAGLKKQLRGSPYVHADETPWRQSGQNGYLWSFSTPCVRYFVYDKSRSHAVPEEVLGEAYQGVVISDFYGGYNYHLGPHQRCWVHLLRDVHKLKQQFPTPGVLEWAQKLRDLYDRAKAFSSECKQARRAARLEFQAELLELALPLVRACLPQSVLCQRLVDFEAELFTFVEYPGMPSENNAAERSVRPRVIARKISGGTRSGEGSKSMAVLSSLFETWRLNGEDCLEKCRQMLSHFKATAGEPAS